MTNTFDIDGCIFMGPGRGGVYPGPNDIIITGRSTEEMPETIKMLNSKNIQNVVYFNSVPYKEKTRENAGYHKAKTIMNLIAKGEKIDIHFEDDPIQASIIKELCPNVEIVLLVHDLLTKENTRHYDY